MCPEIRNLGIFLFSVAKSRRCYKQEEHSRQRASITYFGVLTTSELRQRNGEWSRGRNEPGQWHAQSEPFICKHWWLEPGVLVVTGEGKRGQLMLPV